MPSLSDEIWHVDWQLEMRALMQYYQSWPDQRPDTPGNDYTDYCRSVLSKNANFDRGGTVDRNPPE